MYIFGQESASDAPAINALTPHLSRTALDASVEIKAARHAEAGLSQVAHIHGDVVASVRFWRATLLDLMTRSTEEILFLGHVAMDDAVASDALRVGIISHAMDDVKSRGFARVLAVGNGDVLKPLGFSGVLPRYITLSGGRGADQLLVWQRGHLKSLPSVGLVIPLQEAPSKIDRARLPAFAPV